MPSSGGADIPMRTTLAMLVTALLGLALPLRAAHAQPPLTSMRTDIEFSLKQSAAGWNTGDMARFMAAYLPGDRTTYASKNGYLHGPESIQAHYLSGGYAKQFTPAGPHDQLRFADMEIDSLAPTLAYVMAFYVLTRNDSTIGRGPTSLLMQRVDGKWYIVHDHSS
jgi:ketosteroid isomerase-like protein